jgi:hypothetical protein
MENQILANTSNYLPEIEADSPSAGDGSVSRIDASNGAAVASSLESSGGPMGADIKTAEFDVQKTADELRGYLKSEADFQTVATTAMKDKAAAALKAGELLTEVAKNHQDAFDEVCRIAGLAKTRVYELMRAAKGGLEALEAIQEGNRQRQQKYRERKKARTKSAKAAKSKADLEKVSVTVGGVTESPPTQPVGNGLDPEVAAEARKAEYAAMEQGEDAAAPANSKPTATHELIVAPEEKAQRQKETEERRAQTREKQEALQDHDDQQDRVSGHLGESSTGVDCSAAAKPTPGSPPAPKETFRGVAEALTQDLHDWLESYGIDPATEKVRQAIQTFVAAVVPAPAQ